MKILKKIMAVCASIMIIGSQVIAETPVPEVGRYEPTGIVNVTGQIDTKYGGDKITFLLKSKADGELLNIGETTVENDGSYRAKFKYKGDISDCELSVRQGEHDVVDTIISAVAEEDAIVYSLEMTNGVNMAGLKLDIENWYNVEGKTYTAILAYYNENKELISIKRTPVSDIKFDDENEQTIYDEIPDETAYIKAFLWNSIAQAVPLCNAKDAERLKNLRVLAIGNSFVDDPLAYLKSLAAADGVTLNVTGATHGGASLQNHWEAWQSGTEYYWNNTTIEDYLNDGIYDIITIQQVSHLSGDKSTYLPYAENMVKYLREKQPTAEIVLQETWAYENGKTSNPETMHNNTKSAVEYYCEYLADVTTDSGLSISLDGEPLRYIPTGDAVWNARQNDMFDTTWSGSASAVPVKTVTLWRDGFHLSYPYGRYLAALTWYGCLTGNSVMANKYSNTTYPISDSAKTIIKEAVDKAITEYGRW